MFFNYRRIFWLSIIMTLFVFAPFYVGGFSTDVWMRFVRIQEWMKNSFPMRETLMYSQNYPYGVQMHWTRFMDIVGYVCAWPLMSWLGFKKAMEIMALFVPILTMLVGIRGYFYGMRGYFSPKCAFFSFWLFFYGIGYIWKQSVPGYFDHHVFHFTLLVWVVALILRGLRFNKIGCYVGAGLLAALGTWITPEFSVIPYLMVLPGILYWLVYGYSLRSVIAFLNTYTLVLLLCLIINPPIAGIFHIDLCNFSFFYVLLGLFALVPILVLEFIPLKVKKQFRFRLEWGLFLFALTGLVFLWTIEPFMGQAFFDGYQYNLWISKVAEMASIPLLGIYTHVELPMCLAFFMIWWAFKGRLKNKYSPFIFLTAPGLFIYSFIYASHVRVGITVDVFFIFLTALYVHITFFPREKSKKDTLIFLLVYLPFIAILTKGDIIKEQIETLIADHYYEQYKKDQNIAVPVVLKESFVKRLEQEKNPQKVSQESSFSCTPTEDTFKSLSELGITAMWTDIFSAPQLVWETGIPVFGGPYHTNIQGLDDLFAVQIDRPPFDRAKQILLRRGISHLYIRNPRCEGYLFSHKEKELPIFQESFQYHLYHQTKKLPKWVKLVYKDEKTGIKIFKVQSKGGKNGQK